MSQDIILHEPRAENVLDVDLIKRTICKDASDDELALFISQCKRTGLDPFAKQIHALKRKVKDGDGKWVSVLSIQIGIDGFRLIADRTERYIPGREPSFQYDKNGYLLSATAYVKVWRREAWHEVPATAMYAEYVQTVSSGDPNAMWSKMPHSQLAKCAEALALRKAFPAELSGLYTPDEMAQADNAPTVTVHSTQTVPEVRALISSDASQTAAGPHVSAEDGDIDAANAASEEESAEQAAEKARIAKEIQKQADKAAYEAFVQTASGCGFAATGKVAHTVLARIITKKDRPTAQDLDHARMLRNPDWNAAIDQAHEELGLVKPPAKGETEQSAEVTP